MVVCVTTPIGNRVRATRLQRGLSQKQLARAARVPRPWLSLVELGDIAQPGGPRMERVAEVLGISVAYLWHGRGPEDEPVPVVPVRPEDAADITFIASLPSDAIRLARGWAEDLAQWLAARATQPMLQDVPISEEERRAREAAKGEGSDEQE